MQKKPNVEDYVSVFIECPSVSGWPSYTPRHRVPFSSPPSILAGYRGGILTRLHTGSLYYIISLQKTLYRLITAGAIEMHVTHFRGKWVVLFQTRSCTRSCIYMQPYMYHFSEIFVVARVLILSVWRMYKRGMLSWKGSSENRIYIRIYWACLKHCGFLTRTPAHTKVKNFCLRFVMYTLACFVRRW
jgi:hypothetical protein